MVARGSFYPREKVTEGPDEGATGFEIPHPVLRATHNPPEFFPQPV